MDWQNFFEPNSSVMALPDWRSPRLLVPAGRWSQRWSGVGFYPANRFRARAYRMGLRAKAAIGWGSTQQSGSSASLLADFVRPVFPEFQWAAVYIGTRGAAQKMTARLFDSGNRIIGYIKTGATDAAVRRLRHEKNILTALPTGIGPKVSDYGRFGRGEAMLLAPVCGRPLGMSLTPPVLVHRLLAALAGGESHRIGEHPGMEFARGGPADRWLGSLDGVDWPVVIQHGDLTPWNIIKTNAGEGAPCAIDWEYASLNGFPYLDLAYYVLTIAALIRHCEPSAAAAAAADVLRAVAPKLNLGQITALVALSAYDAYRKALDDGDSPDEPLQQWQRAIWEKSPDMAVVPPVMNVRPGEGKKDPAALLT